MIFDEDVIGKFKIGVVVRNINSHPIECGHVSGFFLNSHGEVIIKVKIPSYHGIEEKAYHPDNLKILG